MALILSLLHLFVQHLWLSLWILLLMPFFCLFSFSHITETYVPLILKKSYASLILKKLYVSLILKKLYVSLHIKDLWSLFILKYLYFSSTPWWMSSIKDLLVLFILKSTLSYLGQTINAISYYRVDVIFSLSISIHAALTLSTFSLFFYIHSMLFFPLSFLLRKLHFALGYPSFFLRWFPFSSLQKSPLDFFVFWDSVYTYRFLVDGHAKSDLARGVIPTTPGKTISLFSVNEDRSFYGIPPSLIHNLSWGANMSEEVTEIDPIEAKLYNNLVRWNLNTRTTGTTFFFF